MDEAIKEARRGAKEGEYKWVVLDDFNLYASWLEQDLGDKFHDKDGRPDGRAIWRPHVNKLSNILIRLSDARAHLYVITHLYEQSSEMEGQLPKSGKGIWPLIGGSARRQLPGQIGNVLIMEFNKKNERVFQVNPQGVYGASCTGIDGTHEIPADIGELHKLFLEFKKGLNTPSLKRVK